MLRARSLLVLTFSTLVISCKNDDEPIPNLDFRQEMREFVQEISAFAKDQDASFLIIPQNGQEILTQNSQPTGAIATAYVNAIDGVGREDLFYGYTADNTATPAVDRDYLISICDVAKNNSKVVLTTDYCSTQSKMDDSYTSNQSHGYISFAADHRELDNIPSYPATIHNENTSDITSFDEVKNFLYLINPNFANKQAYLDAIKATNYDLVLIDLFFDDVALTASDITSLKTKENGGSRLVVCYMSIGES
jgi:cysteinyl-tRNA synthetase, unknown class